MACRLFKQDHELLCCSFLEDPRQPEQRRTQATTNNNEPEPPWTILPNSLLVSLPTQLCPKA
eukprot:m.283433 g.283433  ORF g.283433 m.283433 type:complete len:62 (+) comp129677_c0_seq1:61-246(+)